MEYASRQKRKSLVRYRFGLSKLSPTHREKLVFFSDNVNASKEAEGKIFFKNYTYEDGFLGFGVNGGKTICEDKNGTIWVAANDRLTAFHPEGEVTDTTAPNIQLTSIALFNENIAWVNLTSSVLRTPSSKEKGSGNNFFVKDTTIILGNGVSVGGFEFNGLTRWYNLPGNLSLAYNNNYITFNFIGIIQNQPKKVKYQYKLEGLDENWSAITNRTEAPYGNLPQGNYTFKVKAINSEGYWSSEFNYTFTIRPPWWKTWWMYTIYVISALLLIGGFIKWRERKLKKENIILEKKITVATQVIREEKDKVEEQKKAVEVEKKKSDDLLLNILPAEVAEELKAKGTTTAKDFSEVTVLFTDFKNFTLMSEKLSAQELVNQINYCYSAFDNIITKHGIEKIKTIGDSYMCAGGLPVANTTNAEDTVSAALEIRDFMLAEKQKRESEGKPFFEIRIGCNTGSVVAGIVGIKKFAYDIWGDTVNIASRMESSGEPGKVNISGSTYKLVKDKFKCEHRGEIEAKNKGMIDMYFVEN